jgi:hypothetical protein
MMDKTGCAKSESWDLPVPNQSAAYKSLAKYGKDILPLDEDQVKAMNLAWDFTERHFGVYMGNAKVMTQDEAIQHLDMSTSPGAPFTQFFATKKELFEADPKFVEWLLNDWEKMAQPGKWSCLFTNSLKEEVRPQEKIDDNSIRTFLSGGVDAVVHGTRLFVDMNERLYASALKSSSAVGLSPYKGNWNKLFLKLNVFKNGYALDESQYDSSLRSYLMWACALLRWRMLRSEDRTVENLIRLRQYYRNLVWSLVIGPDGVIVMKKSGNPSGSVNTISDNTIILYALLAYAWIRLVPKDMQTLSAFEDNTAKALVGDDNTWTVSDIAHEYFNARTIIAEWKKIGITTTTDSLEPRCAADLDFLSAHTVFLKGKAVPVYDRDKLMTSLLYAPKEHLTPATTLERTAGLLSIGWVDLPFRRFCRDVIEWLMQEYDDVLRDDPRWLMAKCQIANDDKLQTLFLGDKYVFLHTQALSGDVVKINKPDKRNMNASTQSPPALKKQTRNKRRKQNRAVSQAKNQKQARAAVPPRRRRRNRNGPKPVRYGGPGVMIPNKGPNGLSRRSCPVQEHEFIYDVIGNGADFGIVNGGNPFPLNPAQATTFPWLSTIAKQWERYRIKYLDIEYRREVSEFATAGTTGKVMIHVDLDAADGPPATKTQVLDTDRRLLLDMMPCENKKLRIPGRLFHPVGSPLLSRPGGLPSATDIRLYDAGNIWVSTSGTVDNTTKLGEIHLNYAFELSVPVLESTTTAPINNSLSSFSETNSAAGATTVAQVQPLATVVTNGLGITNTAGSFTLPVGNFMVSSALTANNNAGSHQVNYQLNKNGSLYGIMVSDTLGAAGNLSISLPEMFIASTVTTDIWTFVATATYAAGAETYSAVATFSAL